MDAVMRDSKIEFYKQQVLIGQQQSEHWLVATTALTLSVFLDNSTQRLSWWLLVVVVVVAKVMSS